ncbi:DNA (cytosine-5-)-methyltransferase [Sarracenia purpurea var. burkii]
MTGDQPQSKATVVIDDVDVGLRSPLIGSEEKGFPEGGIVDSSDKFINDGGLDRSVNLGGSEEIEVLEELENRASEGGVNGRFLVGDANSLESSISDKNRDSQVDGKRVGEKMRYRASDFRNKDVGARNRGSEQRCCKVEKDGFSHEDKGLVELNSRENDRKFDARNDGMEHSGSRLGEEHVEVGKSSVSMLDEFAANEAIVAGLSTSVGYGYEIGDMIWGKVKSHPWWPGHIYNEALALPSVRWTRKEGHVLVAFFGDNSYGWFDAAELLPFDTYFSEKSRQANSRNFVKAMKDAVDEASRRRGLGLACRCRNPYNFRPINVQGYFAVDVDDYEPAGVYSVSQIRKARDSFRPRDTVSFMKQLALMPTGDGSIEFIKNKSTILAYRRAVFEEFDETYAQAFGQQPVRPSRESRVAMAQPMRGPLSGPLVVAEVLGKRKNSTKANKAKGLSDKDGYLFKRRDEGSESRIRQIGQGTSSMQPDSVEGSTGLAAGNYVLQKRAPEVSLKQQNPPKLTQALTLGTDDGSVSPNEEVVTIEDKTRVARSFNVAGAMSDTSKIEQPTSFADGFPASQAAPSETSHLLEPKSAFEAAHEQEQVHSIGNAGHVLPMIDAKFHHGQDSRMCADTETKKAKLLKRSVGELDSEISPSGENKKKKKKVGKELGMEMCSDHLPMQAATGKGGFSFGRANGKSIKVGLPSREDFLIEHQKTDNGVSSSSLPESLGTGDIEPKIPQLLGDLQALALNSFHGVERNIPSIIQRAFLRFRSLVYQKSLAQSPAGINAGSDNLNLPSLKPPKLLVKTDDTTKSGRKRGPSDRQEESAAKRLKKINDLKSLAVEKKASQKTLDAQRDGKETMAVGPTKPLKPDSVKKMEPRPKSSEPTALVMRFPPKTSLPSGSELKARLARFGPLDHSGTRIFWQTLTCRVVFLHRIDAEAAHRHLSGNNALFGNMNVRCYLRTLGAMAPESESKVQPDDAAMETPQLKNSGAEQRPLPAQQQPLQNRAAQLRSCLKRPTGDEGGTTITTTTVATINNGGDKIASPRVKFVLAGGESSSMGDQLVMVGNKNNFNNTSFADGASCSSSSSHGMDFNSKNFLEVIPSFHQLPPIPPYPIPTPAAQFPNAPMKLHYSSEVVAPKNTHNLNAEMGLAVPSSTKVDVAQQMLSLLVKCNYLVTDVSSFLGYVPYHPL